MNPTQRQAWLAERRTGIGGSDIAAVCGLDPWRTPLHVYMDKLGLTPSLPMSEPMEWGLRLEPAIAEKYAEVTGRPVRRVQAIRRHPSRPWQITTLDYETECGERNVEIKTTGFQAHGFGQPGTDDVPDNYILQAQHQMATTSAPVTDFAVLVGGNNFRLYTVERNEQLVEYVTTTASLFWHQHILAKRPPQPDWSHAEMPALIRSMFGVDDALAIDLVGEEALSLADEYVRLGEHQNAAREAREVCRAKLIYAMGEASRATLDDGSIITRKQVRRAAYSVGAAEYIDVRIRKAKVRQQ